MKKPPIPKKTRKLTDKELKKFAKFCGCSIEDILFHTGGEVFDRCSKNRQVAIANSLRVWTKESRAKFGKAIKDKCANDEEFRKSRINYGPKNGMYGKDRSGPNNPRFGVVVSEETKAKIRAGIARRKAGNVR